MVVGNDPEEKAVHPIELVLARLLRLGSLAAAALLAVGIAVMVLGQTELAPKLITAGLLVLLGTPVLRVVAAAIIFVKERDWHFALFSLVVLCAVAAGIYFGKGG
ncbi:DUF1634 domain-containing protein [Geomonas nitrogeniifigens]|uniref:DUF1634 domain-containing protein n=1 Tax=Geomonas diazotrophica TaxID=2843197 RepID=A0ABX8JIL3_9BACT|nr:DUF1634 domain-containing protein [Geomonas nitrogeniifigens]QXE85580.1 DUF1634 domain-containing protein [Geomonas nitrogeniifigens]